MGHFDMPVRVYMTRGVHSVKEGTPVETAWQQMHSHRISSVPVLDEAGHMIGVISRADLLREGTINHEGDGASALELPELTAGELMLGVVVKVGPDASVAEAADLMCEQHIHRVYVERDGMPVGVLSVRDVMQAVVDKRIDTPLSEFMTETVVVVPLHTPLSEAADALATGAMTGLIVVDGNWPAGVLTQEEALIARHHAPETAVEKVMGPELIVLPPSTPAYRAAAQAVAMHVRRVVILGENGVQGILSGLDLAKLAAANN